MPDMVGRLRLGLLVVVAMAACLGACVPDPANRPTASAGDGDPSPSSASAVAPTPGPSGPSPLPTFVRPTPNPSPTFLVHVVRRGDTLTSIARLFGTTARSIAFWNRDRYPSLDPDAEAYAPNRIEIGWTLGLIPNEVVAEDELPDPAPSPTPNRT